MAPRLQILFVTPEVTPFARTGGLGDVSGALPKALAALGHEVRIVMPLYQAVRDQHLPLRQALVDVRVPHDPGTRIMRVLQADLPGPPHQAATVSPITVYFIEQEDYFTRPGLYGNESGDYPDNAERFAFFCRAVLALMTRLDWWPDVLHCHDWQTALLAAYKRFLPGLDQRFYTIPLIYTIHNLAYQGIFPAWTMSATGLPWTLFHPDGIEFFGNLNLMKAGLLYADYLTTVSPSYAEEICTPACGVGLDGVLARRRSALQGILNGADYDVWNPATDAAIAASYTASSLQGKTACKAALLRAYDLPEDLETPLIGMISRLVDQKGVDILAAALDCLLGMEVRLVILGSGEPQYQELLASQASAHPGRMGVRLEFNDALAHHIEAGSDCFLMPSRYEPCGLNQLYSMRYGTIPIVRATGGLRDTVSPYRAETGEGTGFVFQEATAEALLQAVQAALATYANRTAWQQLMRQAMAQDFSWEQSAKQYLDLYQQALHTP
jgi:starch synthase